MERTLIFSLRCFLVVFWRVLWIHWEKDRLAKFLHQHSLRCSTLVKSHLHFYRTWVRSLAMFVSHSLTDSLIDSLLFSKLDWCDVWLVKMPTQNLLRLLLLLMLTVRIVLATVCCRLGSWGLIIKLSFCSDFEHKVSSRYEVESCPRFES